MTEREVRFLTREVSRILSMVRVNPLTREELEFLKSVVEKVLSGRLDEVTMEEAERFAEIGKRWWLEEGREEAYKIFLTGLYIKAYLLSREVVEEREGSCTPS